MRIVFFGTPSFAVPSLDALIRAGYEVAAVVTQPDKRKGRSSALSPPPVKELALRMGLKVMQPERIRDLLFIGALKGIGPELIAVVAYGKIIPPDILKLPRRGCINVHASLLPNYRGAAPIPWAIIRGEEKTGITTMLMDEGLDTGDILLQDEIDIERDDTAETLSKRMAESGAALLIKTLRKMEDGSLKPAPQTGIPSYAPPLKKGDGRIDWAGTAEDIYNFVRGMYPWPCAYCYLKNERIKITRVKVIKGPGIAGRVEDAGGQLIVGTGKELISIIELQPEGKKLMTAQDFLRGRRLKEGFFFDGP
jgi:methionyl-tRNA formyltransferase